ncbi:hypothetical protein NFI96_007599 [Prochilodus magdalenae]|nr:hypothetical protein NFI96_007599 [Prochilodus magdalenae]
MLVSQQELAPVTPTLNLPEQGEYWQTTKIQRKWLKRETESEKQGGKEREREKVSERVTPCSRRIEEMQCFGDPSGITLSFLRLGCLSERCVCNYRAPSVPLQPGQSFKFTVLETLDRIKEEFQFLQAQYHSLKLECEKLASEKTEMQRHYIMGMVCIQGVYVGYGMYCGVWVRACVQGMGMGMGMGMGIVCIVVCVQGMGIVCIVVCVQGIVCIVVCVQGMGIVCIVVCVQGMGMGMVMGMVCVVACVQGMYYEMSYGLNIEMHKQAEIVKRLSAICAQIIPFLSQESKEIITAYL